MPLYTPSVNLADTSTNLPSTPSLTPGATVTAGAANVKGSWAQCIAATPFDSAFIAIAVNNIHTAATATQTLLDIGTGANPNEVAIINNLLIGQTPGFTYASGQNSRTFLFPLFIPRGTRISARCQSLVASKSARVCVAVYSGGSLPFPAFSAVDTLGVTTASSAGTSVTAGNTGAAGSWTSVGSTTTRGYGGVMMSLQGTGTVITQLAYHYNIGISSAAIPSAGSAYLFATDAGEALSGPWPNLPVLADIPSGAQLQVRGTCSGTAEAQQAALYCLY